MNYAKRFSRGHWTFFGPGDEKKYGTLSKTLEGTWDSTTTQMVDGSKETGHPVFKSISALSRGIVERKNNRDTVHFNADASNKHRKVVSNGSFSKSAQYLRSSLNLV